MGLTTAKRSWDVERDGKRYRVEMEDEYFLGRRVVRVNDEVAYTGRTVLADHSGAYEFDLAGRPAFLKIRTNGIRYFYDLVTDSLAAEPTRPIDPKDLVQRPPNLVAAAAQFLISVSIAVGLVILTDGRLYSEPLVAVAGAPVDAVVTRATTSSKGAHRLEYRFTVDGHTYGHGTFASEERFDAALSSGIVAVRYLQSAPDVSALVPQPSDLGVDVLLLVIIVTGGGWTALGALAEVRRYAVWQRLSAGGSDTMGTVTRVRTLRTAYGVVTGCVLEYSYEAGNTTSLHGRSGAFGMSAAVQYPIGTSVHVRYDSDRPRDSILVTRE
jgi:uncharacterized protein DUF3592/FAIM1 (Fas apoptotic inhibitory molecule) protein